MSAAYPYNEKELLALISQGDESAFKTLFEKWHNKLGGFVIKWTGSEAIAEEIVQDVFLKIWVNRHLLGNVENFDKYLYTLSRNHSFNALRQIERQRLKFKQWLLDTEADVADPIDLPDTNMDYSFLIEQAVRTLPEQQKRVYLLKYQQKKKYENIGAEMGISPETARKHMQAATKSIAKYLRNHTSILLILSKFF